MFADFLCPETIQPLTVASENWLGQFYEQPVVMDEVKLYSFSKRNHSQGKDVYYGFNGALIFSSLITVDHSPMHSRYGLPVGKHSLRLSFTHIPKRLHVGIGIYKRRQCNSHFLTLIAQDADAPENYAVYWCDYLGGNLKEVFSAMNGEFVDMQKWNALLATKEHQ